METLLSNYINKYIYIYIYIYIIATHHGLGDPRLELRWRRYFLDPSRPAQRPTKPPAGALGPFFGEKVAEAKVQLHLYVLSVADMLWNSLCVCVRFLNLTKVASAMVLESEVTPFDIIASNRRLAVKNILR